MKSELEETNKNAANILTNAFKGILNDQEIKNYCLNYLQIETANSIKRRNIYLEKCNEQWQTVLWCFCSLNSKGSAKASKGKWLEDFNQLSKLINPENLNSLLSGNEEKIFCAINLILRNYAGGRFLTISEKYYPKEYSEFQKIEFPKNEDLIRILDNSNLSVLELNKKFNTESYKLFNIFQKNKFQTASINESFSNLNLMTTNVLDIIKTFKQLGINKKFARNIKMDILSDNIDGYYAIDSRISGVLDKIKFGNVNLDKDYEKLEHFFNSIIKEEKYLGKVNISYKNRTAQTGFSSWEFDRLLFKLSDSTNNILFNFLK